MFEGKLIDAMMLTLDAFIQFKPAIEYGQGTTGV